MKTIYVIAVDSSAGWYQALLFTISVIGSKSSGFQRNSEFLKFAELVETLPCCPKGPFLTKLTKRKLNWKLKRKKFTMWLLLCCLKEPVLTKIRQQKIEHLKHWNKFIELGVWLLFREPVFDQKDKLNSWKVEMKLKTEKLTMWLLLCCLKDPDLTKSRTRSRPRSWRGSK